MKRGTRADNPQRAATALKVKEPAPRVKEPTPKLKTSTAKEKISPAERLERLLTFDRNILSSGTLKTPAQVIIGTDEVGRGCLAGPVVACAVVLPPIPHDSELFHSLVRLNDSKTIPPEVRAKLSETLRGICQFAIAEASVDEIDEINILHASLLAMKRAIRKLRIEQDAVILVDGNKSITTIKNIEQVTVIDGDNKSASIAAASVIAKVHRDAFMCKLSQKFPEYKWESNKGYQSRDHYDALYAHGMTEWHRNSFNCGVNRQDETDPQLKIDFE